MLYPKDFKINQLLRLNQQLQPENKSKYSNVWRERERGGGGSSPSEEKLWKKRNWDTST